MKHTRLRSFVILAVVALWRPGFTFATQCYNHVCNGIDCLNDAIRQGTAATCDMIDQNGCFVLTAAVTSRNTTVKSLVAGCELNVCSTLSSSVSDGTDGGVGGGKITRICCNHNLCNIEKTSNGDNKQPCKEGNTSNGSECTFSTYYMNLFIMGLCSYIIMI